MPQVRKKGVQQSVRAGIECLYDDKILYSAAGLAIIAGATTGTLSVPTVLAGLSIISTAKTTVNIAKATTPIVCSAVSGTATIAQNAISPLYQRLTSNNNTHNIDPNEPFDVLDEDGQTIAHCKLSNRKL